MENHQLSEQWTEHIELALAGVAVAISCFTWQLAVVVVELAWGSSKSSVAVELVLSTQQNS